MASVTTSRVESCILGRGSLTISATGGIPPFRYSVNTCLLVNYFFYLFLCTD